MAGSKPRMPYFQFYPTDFLASGKVALMDPCEVGAHVLLMCQAWLSDPPASVPDDDRILCRWARMTIETWAESKLRILAAWELRDGRWFQPRMEAEWVIAQERAAVLSENGRKGGLKSAQARLKPGLKPGLTEAQASSYPYPESESDGLERGVSVATAVARLNLGKAVGRDVEGLDGLTVREIAETVVAVRAMPNVRDVGIVVATELLRRRGKPAPQRRTRGNVPESISVATNATVGKLAEICRARNGRNA